jgi:hypothetical protein
MSTNSEALLAKIKQRNEDAEAIKAYFQSLFPDGQQPSQAQCINWLLCAPSPIITKALDATFVAQQIRLNNDPPKPIENPIQYASGCIMSMLRMKEESP